MGAELGMVFVDEEEGVGVEDITAAVEMIGPEMGKSRVDECLE